MSWFQLFVIYLHTAIKLILKLIAWRSLYLPPQAATAHISTTDVITCLYPVLIFYAYIHCPCIHNWCDNPCCCLSLAGGGFLPCSSCNHTGPQLVDQLICILYFFCQQTNTRFEIIDNHHKNLATGPLWTYLIDDFTSDQYYWAYSFCTFDCHHF